MIHRRVPVATHFFAEYIDGYGVLVKPYVLLRSDGKPEIRQIRAGVDRVVCQKFTRIPVPPPDRWWEGVEGRP